MTGMIEGQGMSLSITSQKRLSISDTMTLSNTLEDYGPFTKDVINQGERGLPKDDLTL